MREIKFIAKAASFIIVIFCIYSCVKVMPCENKFMNEHPNYSIDEMVAECEK